MGLRSSYGLSVRGEYYRKHANELCRELHLRVLRDYDNPLCLQDFALTPLFHRRCTTMLGSDDTCVFAYAFLSHTLTRTPTPSLHEGAGELREQLRSSCS